MSVLEKFRTGLFSYILKVIRNRQSAVDKVFYFFLLLLSFFFNFLVYLKNIFYQLGLFKSQNIKKIFVLGIGNLEAGGSGKTPHCLYFARYLTNKGIKTAIISRGYRSRAEKGNDPMIITKKSSHGLVGDEPKMMAEKTDVLVIVGKDRMKGIRLAGKKGCKCAILDDSFQCRKIKKDFEIVLLDAAKPFFNNRFLPAGFLRESKSELKRAGLVILTNNQNAGEEGVMEVKRNFQKEIIFSSARIDDYRNLKNKKINIQPKTKVAVFCAIAKPKNFKKSIAEAFEVVDELFLLDHADIEKRALMEFSERAKKKGAKYLICTEKDKVKLAVKNYSKCLPIIYARMEIELSDVKFLKKILKDDKFSKKYNKT